MGTNRITGDFNHDAVEAFRAAYSAQMATPDEQESGAYLGLPTNVVPNTSPWIAHTGLWKYPSGKGPDDDLKTAFNPSDYLPEVADEEEEGGFDESLSAEELDALVDNLLGTLDEDEE